MTFIELFDFLEHHMRMQHIYQPLLIRALVESGGTATLRQLAQAFVLQDESQLRYYEDRIKAMPLQVLKGHGIVEERDGLVSLATGPLTYEQKVQVKALCEQRVGEYVGKRGMEIWDYKLRNPYEGDHRPDVACAVETPRVAAEQFWERFATRLREKLGPHWLEQYKSSTEWTALMITFLNELATDFHYSGSREIAQEYYRIDVGYFRQPETRIHDGAGKDLDYDWDLDVAIEHENNNGGWSDWLDEFVKLIHISCGLKVIITYHDYSGQRSIEEKLQYAAELYSRCRYRLHNDNWLIIFGPMSWNRGEDFVAYPLVGGVKQESLRRINILTWD